jgi:hypothetical protein
VALVEVALVDSEAEAFAHRTCREMFSVEAPSTSLRRVVIFEYESLEFVSLQMLAVASLRGLLTVKFHRVLLMVMRIFSDCVHNPGIASAPRHSTAEVSIITAAGISKTVSN